MTTTTNHALTLMGETQESAHIIVNEMMRRLDLTANRFIIKSQETAPPGSPAEGDAHMVIATATGDYAGEEGNIALYVGGGWTFYTPRDGDMICRVDLDNAEFTWCATRSHWLGEHIDIFFTNATSYSSSNAIRAFGGTFGNSSGVLIPWDGVVTEAHRSDSDGGWVGDFDLQDLAVDVATAVLAGDTNTTLSQTGLDHDVSEGAQLNLQFNWTSGTLGLPCIHFRIRRKGD